MKCEIFPMMKKIGKISFFLFLLNCHSSILFADAISLPKPFLILGNDNSFGKSRSEELFYKALDIAQDLDGNWYILDSGNGRVQCFSANGKYRKSIGDLGQGPGELFRPNSLSFINNELWVADSGNNRISILKNFKFEKIIKLLNVPSPFFCIPSGENVFVGSSSLRQPGTKSIILMDKNGNQLKAIDVAIHVNQIGDQFWNCIQLVPFKDGCLVGFLFQSKITILTNKGIVKQTVDLEKYYSGPKKKDKTDPAPEGFAAMTFSEGPGSTVLVVICNHQKKICNRIYMFSEDLASICREYFFNKDVTISRIKYFRSVQVLTIITSEDEVIFYKI